MSEPMKQVDPFAMDPDDLDPQAVSSQGLRDALKPWLIGLSIIAFAAAIALWVISDLPFVGDIDVYLQGPGLEALKANSQVVLGRQQIGRVEKVELLDGQPVARLLIKSEFARDLPEDTAFKVVSLNDWLPGNLGVVAMPSAHSQGDKAIQRGTIYTTTSSLTPTGIPAGFYILGGMIVAALIGGVILTRILKTWLVLILTIAGIIAILSYLNIRVSL